MKKRVILYVLVMVSFIVSGSYSWAADAGEKSLSDGLALFQQGDYQAALEEFQKAARQNPKLEGLYLNMGMAHFKLDRYDAAITSLKKAVQQDAKDGSAYFFLGMSHYSTEQYQDAISSFQKAKQHDVDFAQLSFYYIGLSHYSMGQNGNAEKNLNQAVAVDPQSDTANDVRQLLATISQEKKQKAKLWWITPRVGWEYDDNLTVEELDVVSGRSDHAWIMEVESGYRFYEQNSIEAEVTYDFYKSVYDDLDEFDTQTHTLGAAGSYSLGKWDVGLDYLLSYMRLDDKDFLWSHTIMPGVSGFLGDNIYGSFSYIFQDKDYRQRGSENRDGDNHSIGGDLFYFFLDNRAYVLVGYRFEIENTDGAEFDYDGGKTTVAVNLPVWFQGEVKVSYKYHVKDYHNITPAIGRDRKDTKKTLNFVWAKTFMENFEAKLDYQYIDSNSNLDTNEYTENISYISCAYKF